MLLNLVADDGSYIDVQDETILQQFLGHQVMGRAAQFDNYIVELITDRTISLIH